ncbi:unnamed protein product [Chondrus crispus]|uniref:Uncharacterized protein n=1 Tax=Chondrus crispus TaxID=2769 RepID=R7Q6U8_CHOCR|nr:unnamed protein product [Chondrus crispus]CDF33195.1 unnamed protein product [Chondrus crispus]|eukprot:XP_005712998.1 unnamed protein product [Chondrus crispus]
MRGGMGRGRWRRMMVSTGAARRKGAASGVRSRPRPAHVTVREKVYTGVPPALRSGVYRSVFFLDKALCLKPQRPSPSLHVKHLRVGCTDNQLVLKSDGWLKVTPAEGVLSG